MAFLQSIPGSNAKIFRDNELLYLHCVSKDDFKVIPVSLDCMEMKCREVVDPMCGLDIPAYDLSQEQLSMFSTEQHTENIPVKLELRYAIECRRDDIGPDIDYLQSGEFWNDSNKEASPEEEERRKQRRERNKVAASKCRHKRREHVRNLTKASDELENQNRSLQGEISKLQGEIKKLEFMLDSHDCAKDPTQHLYS